ncbi:anthrone oxygenase family protein [Nocardia halotolerans]|uniref:Anthrone oxygenase family protein n=1 Tax=Nocardia halotolerans TaxID=1755878 RepID=A0ABV8VRS5_9NOCA
MAAPTKRPRLTRAAALLSSGLLGGCFLYGGANVLYAFREVPLDVRLTFHTALMSANSVVVQALMALTAATCLLLAVRAAGVERLLAAAATVATVAVFLLTRLGNVPINQDIKVWAATGPPTDYAELLARWEAFHLARVSCALLAFVLIVATTGLSTKEIQP